MEKELRNIKIYSSQTSPLCRPIKMSATNTHPSSEFSINQSSPLQGTEAPRSKNFSFFILSLGLIAGFGFAQFFTTGTLQGIYPCIRRKCFEQCSVDQSQVQSNTTANSDQDQTHKNNDYNTSIADKLRKEVQILCFILTDPQYHKTSARDVKRTWGKRCNILLFMSSKLDRELPTVKLDVDEGRKNWWRDVTEAFKYVYEHHYNDAHWFFKADDNTYAVIENLRYMLYPYSPETPISIGYAPFPKKGFRSVALSREALRRFVVEGIPKATACGVDTKVDVNMTNCMEYLNITAVDSRDFVGKARMLPPLKEYNNISGPNCCSDFAVSIETVDTYFMYVIDYLVYQLRLYGVLRTPKRLPAKLKVGELLPKEVE